MTDRTTEDNVSSSSKTPPNQPALFLSVHTAVVLLAGAFIGLVVGGLAFLSGSPVAGAVLAGLAGLGGSVPVLRSLIR
ncbi:hypothetical protein ACFQ6N_25160 [Kitasatospora sp. NPDC056446]|uniref:hypothetical protein n=1 Tax=Kitasatospora sp. NPDC056446 TaxID=3345819 RepID=UPI0036BD5930